MILDAYGRPVRRENRLESPEWLKREASDILAGRFEQIKDQIAEERIEALRESVAEERSKPAAEDKQVGIGIRFIKAFDLVKSERLP